MQRNIKIAYLLSFFKHSWFWMGTWVFYYLRFTNYAGIGLIETVMILTMTLSEIPTGAIGDLLGKKATLFMAFFLEALGSFGLAFAPSLGILIFSVFIQSLGATMYSGTSEALAYDSLKENGDESTFDKVISNMRSYQWIAVTLTGIAGGIMYKYGPHLPYLFSGIFFSIGALVTLFIKEPAIDTDKFSLKNFVIQNKKGFGELFKNAYIGKLSVFMVVIGSIIVLTWEMLESILGVAFGYGPLGLSILFSILFLISAGASQLSKYISKFTGVVNGIVILAIISAFTMLISPLAGLVLGGLSLILRSVVQVNIENLTSVEINKNTESKYRATTISSFNMLKNIPYLLTAYLMGTFMDVIGAKLFAFGLGVILLIWVLVWKPFLNKNEAKIS